MKKSANLPMINVGGLNPVPGVGHEGPFFFPIHKPMNNQNNGPWQDDKGYVAEYYSGKVFAVTDDGNYIGFPDQPVGKWRNYEMAGGRKTTRQTMRRNMMVGGVDPRPQFYIGLRRSPNARKPAPQWTTIRATSPGANASGVRCDVFENKAYKIGADGEPIGYPDQSVGDCVDGYPPANGNGVAAGANGNGFAPGASLLPFSQNGGNKNLPRYNAGFLIPSNASQAFGPSYFSMPKYNDVLAEYRSGLVFKKGANGMAIGYPDQPVGRWQDEFDPEYNGAPLSAREGGRRRTNRRRTNRRRTNRRAGRR